MKGKIPIADAMEFPKYGGPRRIRLKTADECGSGEILASIAEAIMPGARTITEDWNWHFDGMRGLWSATHAAEPRSVPDTRYRLLLPEHVSAIADALARFPEAVTA